MLDTHLAPSDISKLLTRADKSPRGRGTHPNVCKPWPGRICHPMDDSSRYLEGDTLGKGRALGLGMWCIWEATAKRHLVRDTRTVVRMRAECGVCGAAHPSAASGAPTRGSPRSGHGFFTSGWRRPFCPRLTQYGVAQQEAGTSLFCFVAFARLLAG